MEIHAIGSILAFLANLDHCGKNRVPQFGLDICVSLSVYEMHQRKFPGFWTFFFTILAPLVHEK